MKKSRKTLQVVIALIWILFFLIGYYWGHKPFTPQTATIIAKSLLDVGLVFLAVVASGGLGRRILGAVSMTWRERVVLQAAAGMGIYALTWLILGFLSLYSAITAWIILIGSILLNYKACLSWMKEWKAARTDWVNLRPLERAAMVILSFLVILQVMIALAPPLKYDALSYHLQLPRMYREAGRFLFTPENPYWGHPQMGEVLFTWMLLLFRSQTAALLSAVWGILLLIGLSGTVQRLAEHVWQIDPENREKRANLEIDAGLVSALVLMTGLTFRYMFGWAYVDLFTALFGWAALLCMVSTLDSRRMSWQVWTGIFLGFAIGTKWTAGILALGFFTFRLVGVIKNRKLDKGLLVSLVLMVVVVSPWLAKNLLMTGNPVYPYLLPTEWVDAARLDAASTGGETASTLHYLFLPVTATWFGWEGGEGFGADIGPLLFLLAIPGLWTMRKHGFGKVSLLTILFWWLVLILGSQYFKHLQQFRLYFVLLPILALAAGLGWIKLTRLEIPFMRISSILFVFLFLVLGFSIVMDVRYATEISPSAVIMGTEAEGSYLERGLGWYTPAMQSLYSLEDGEKVLMLWEARGFYAPLSATADPWIDNFRVVYWAHQDADQILAHWVQEGYTHLLYYKSGAERIRQAGSPMEAGGWAVLDELTAELPVKQSFGDVYYLYTLDKGR